MDEEKRKSQAVPWTATEIVLVYCVGVLCQVAVHGLLASVGFYRWFYDNDGFASVIEAGGAAAKLARYRLGLWAGALGTMVQVAATLAILRQSCGAALADVGLTVRHFGRNVFAGLVFSLIFVPGAYGLQALAMLVMKLLGSQTQEHPFTLLGQQGLYPAEWVLLVAAAVVLAPLWEELYYRGIVQPWVLSRQPRGGPMALAAALVLTVGMRADRMQAALAGEECLLLEVIPFVVLVAMGGVYAALIRAGRSQDVAGLFATAVLFAWVHVSVWPSPVALVWLAVGLGWLAWRGRSLVGCMVLHAVFNAVACAMLVAQASSRQ